MVDVAGDGTWSHVVRDIEDIVARALASLHLGDRPFAQPAGAQSTAALEARLARG